MKKLLQAALAGEWCFGVLRFDARERECVCVCVC